MKKLLIFPVLFILSCSTEPEDCAGVEGGSAYLDDCGFCDVNSSNDNATCQQDECGIWSGDGLIDLCGICDADSTNDNTTCSFESQILGSWFVVQDFEFSPNEQTDNDKVYVYFEFLTTGVVDFRIFDCGDNETDCTIISNEGNLNDEGQSWGFWDKSGEYQYVCFYDEPMDGSETIAELMALQTAPCPSYELSENELILHASWMEMLGDMPDIDDSDNYFLTLQKCTENDTDIHCYVGCTSEIADNFDPLAQFDDGNCDWNTNIQGSINDINNNPIPNAAILFTYTYGLDGLEGNRPSTTLNISLAEASYVNMWIEETCGDTVIVLVDEYKDAGTYSITWNADDSNGNQVVDGVYTLIMSVVGSNQTEQFITLMVEDYSHLDSIEGQNYHAMTDENGFFSTSLDCLPFGIENMQTDAEGNELSLSLQYKVKIWVIHPDHVPYSTDFIDVDLYVDTDIQITLP